MNERSYLKVETHDTPDTLFDALARVFNAQENGGTRWITFRAEDVDLTFFAKDKSKAEAEA